MTDFDQPDFFIPDSETELPEELDYSSVEPYVRAAEAFARSTYQSVYIIDYSRRKFLYVSPNSAILCGLTNEQMMELNHRFYFDFVPAEEHQMLAEFNREGFAYFHSIPVEERCSWYIQYDFHIINKGRPILINHKLTPLVTTPGGHIWLALSVVSASNHTTPGHMEMHRVDSPDYFEFNILTRRWNRRSMPTLSEGEKSVITLSAQGYTTAEIAGLMCLSPDTIKKYRKQIFDKLSVRNISEAIVAATNNRLI